MHPNISTSKHLNLRFVVEPELARMVLPFRAECLVKSVLGARLRGRMITHASKKTSEKVLVKGFLEGSLVWALQQKIGSEMGFQKGFVEVSLRRASYSCGRQKQ